MIPWETIGEGRAPGGGRLVLTRRGHEWVIRVDGQELMSSRAHGSEDALARLAVAAGADARVLIGGLGMGFTARATLDVVGPNAKVVVAEIVPAVIAWNRGELGTVAARPLDDPRLEVREADVAQVIQQTTARWDAILLDVDNGPQALTRKGNQGLYGETGLTATKSTLKPGGVLAVWSASRDDAFAKRMKKVGFDVTVEDVPARGGHGVKHTIFLGRTQALRL